MFHGNICDFAIIYRIFNADRVRSVFFTYKCMKSLIK